ncbi:hypothetical protein C8J57DRAFT_1236613 [Mycena rebaudengoi]|nr:hypothetical protein C8J57DRAFT_1236613 [Mycena rebaudengoi]
MLYLPLLASTLFYVLGYVHAQFNESVIFFTPPTADTGDYFLGSYSWRGPTNTSLELMVGKAEEINLNAGITSFSYHVRAATPPGDYHIRMNATIRQEGVIDPIGPYHPMNPLRPSLSWKRLNRKILSCNLS